MLYKNNAIFCNKKLFIEITWHEEFADNSNSHLQLQEWRLQKTAGTKILRFFVRDPETSVSAHTKENKTLRQVDSMQETENCRFRREGTYASTLCVCVY